MATLVTHWYYSRINYQRDVGLSWCMLSLTCYRPLLNERWTSIQWSSQIVLTYLFAPAGWRAAIMIISWQQPARWGHGKHSIRIQLPLQEQQQQPLVWSKQHELSHQTRDIHTMLFQCWPSVEDGGPTLKHHSLKVPFLLCYSLYLTDTRR